MGIERGRNEYEKEVMVDMTSGRIAPQILKFAMPVLLGLIFRESTILRIRILLVTFG